MFVPVVYGPHNVHAYNQPLYGGPIGPPSVYSVQCARAHGKTLTDHWTLYSAQCPVSGTISANLRSQTVAEDRRPLWL